MNDRMNRSVKFRAWDRVKESMFTIMRIDFSMQFSPPFSRIFPYPYDDFWRPEDGPQRNEVYEGFETIHRRIDELFVMQSTGLHDKNGKEIFEGDIIECLGSIENGPVQWDQSICQFHCGNENDQPLTLHMQDELEVIGNIYENPELLKK